MLFRVVLVWLAIFWFAGEGITGTWTSNNFFYKPETGARGTDQKNLFDSGLDRIDARLGKEIWVGDPNYGSTLQSALSAIGSNSAMLRIPAGTYNISVDLTVPSNITLKPERGAILSIATTKTLTINGGFEAGPYQVFSCTGTGKVVFASVKEVAPEWWGFTTDAAAAITAALTTGRTVKLAAGKTYPVATSVSVTAAAGQNFKITAESGALIDGTASTQTSLLTVQGAPGSFVALGADVNKGSGAITSALAGSLTAGDIILITSTELWNPIRSCYYKGEMCEVESISGATINLKSVLYDGYVAGTTTIAKVTAPKVEISGLKIRRNSNHEALRVYYAREVLLENCDVAGARECGIRVAYLYGGVIRNNYVTDCWFSGTGTSYGINVCSSQNILEEGNRVFGGRHGIAHGGWEPNRDITLFGNVIDNNHASGTYSLDFHENCERVRVVGNIIKNCLTWCGTDVGIESNTIDVAQGGTLIGVYLLLSKSQNCIAVRNNIITALPSNGFALQAVPNSAGISSKVLDISGNIINSAGYGIYIAPYSEGITSCSIDRLIMRDNQISVGTYAFNLGVQGTAGITVNDAVIKGGTYESTAYRPIYYKPSSSSNSVKFQNLTLRAGEANSYGLMFYQVIDAMVEDCNIVATTSGYQMILNNTGRLIFRRNRVENFNNYQGIHLTTPTTAYFRDNNFVNCPGQPVNFGTTKVMDWTASQGQVVAHGTAVPTTGTWSRGDIVWNTAPAAGGAPGWICTGAGSPGTWKAMANLAN